MKISVALCTYNGEKYIAQQLHSILEQTVSVDEIVLSDDNSGDKTLQIAQEILSHSNVSYKILRNIPAKGVARNFLDALKLTTGDYCFTCDQDDIWCPDKVSKFLSYAQMSGKDLYFSDGILVDADGKPMGNRLWEAYGIRYEQLSEKRLVDTMLRRPVVTGAAMMVSRKLVESADAAIQDILHDEWLSMLAAVSNSAQAINETTFLYRQHGNNVVGAKAQGFFEKAGIWYKNLWNIGKIRSVYLARMRAFDLAAEGTEYQDTVKAAKEFWETLSSLPNVKKHTQLSIITKLLISKQYARYYTGLRGYVRDVLSLLPQSRKTTSQ